MTEKKFVFNIYAFFITFMLGLFYVYISSPKPKIIVKYPTPYNVEKTVYKSDNDLCYKYDAQEVKCEKNFIKQTIL